MRLERGAGGRDEDASGERDGGPQEAHPARWQGGQPRRMSCEQEPSRAPEESGGYSRRRHGGGGARDRGEGASGEQREPRKVVRCPEQRQRERRKDRIERR